MIVEPATIRAALVHHGRKYVRRKGKQAWDVGHHLDQWARGRESFENDDFDSFRLLYNDLKNRWGVGRSKSQTLLPAEEIFKLLKDSPSHLRTLRLADLHDGDFEALWELVNAVGCIKTNSDGASVMALSKFLHFWNPRLFVIVDRGVIWNYVFGHDWIWFPIKKMRSEIVALVPHAACEVGSGSCDCLSYLATLRWAAEITLGNPALAEAFETHVRANAKSTPVPADLRDFMAAAVEWLILGLVEIPPAGVTG